MIKALEEKKQRLEQLEHFDEYRMQLEQQYQKAEKKDHPRMIALDEAFAGVDDKNISSMFELVEKLDFDYIMNSQALWGCFETVHALRIAELLRPLNSKTVSVIYYSWNGKERVLDE